MRDKKCLLQSYLRSSDFEWLFTWKVHWERCNLVFVRDKFACTVHKQFISHVLTDSNESSFVLQTRLLHLRLAFLTFILLWYRNWREKVPLALRFYKGMLNIKCFTFEVKVSKNIRWWCRYACLITDSLGRFIVVRKRCTPYARKNRREFLSQRLCHFCTISEKFAVYASTNPLAIIEVHWEPTSVSTRVLTFAPWRSDDVTLNDLDLMISSENLPNVRLWIDLKVIRMSKA